MSLTNFSEPSSGPEGVMRGGTDALLAIYICSCSFGTVRPCYSYLLFPSAGRAVFLYFRRFLPCDIVTLGQTLLRHRRSGKRQSRLFTVVTPVLSTKQHSGIRIAGKKKSIVGLMKDFSTCCWMDKTSTCVLDNILDVVVMGVCKMCYCYPCTLLARAWSQALDL